MKLCLFIDLRESVKCKDFRIVSLSFTGLPCLPRPLSADSIFFTRSVDSSAVFLRRDLRDFILSSLFKWVGRGQNELMSCRTNLLHVSPTKSPTSLCIVAILWMMFSFTQPLPEDGLYALSKNRYFLSFPAGCQLFKSTNTKHLIATGTVLRMLAWNRWTASLQVWNDKSLPA